MKLAEFLTALFRDGKAVVDGDLNDPAPADRRRALLLLEQQYDFDRAELPYAAPAFHGEAALWAASFLYKAIQLTILRDLDEAAVERHLNDWEGPVTAEIIYSADLVLREMPPLFRLAKGLSPQDVLVQKLHKTAGRWPFSWVGIPLETDSPPELEPLLRHPALRQEYADRIVAHKDRDRASDPRIQPLILEILGGHAATLWPESGIRIPV